MMKSSSWRLLLVACLAIMAACSTKPASRTTVDRVLKAPSVPNAPYHNLVLVGVAPTRDLSRQLEQGVGDELTKRGVTVHSFVKDSSAREVSEQAVDDLAASTGADGVLMITGRMTGGDLDKIQEPVDVEARTIGGNLVNFFRYDYEEYAAPSYTDITVDVTIVSLLFDAKTDDRVHSVDSSTTYGDSAYQIITAQARAIVDRMKKDGIIK